MLSSQELKLSRRGWKAELALVVATLVASVLSFGVVVVLYAASSGELAAAVAPRSVAAAASAPPASAPRRPGSG